MDEKELKLRLIEAASALPGVKLGIDHAEQAKRAVEVADLWYNFLNSSAPTRRVVQNRSREKR